MVSIGLFPTEHEKALYHDIVYKYDKAVKKHIKKLEDVLWTSTHNCFYIAVSPGNKTRLFNHSKQLNYSVFSNEIQTVNERRFKHEDEIISKLGKSGITYLWEYVNFSYFHSRPIAKIINRDLELIKKEMNVLEGYSIFSHRQCINALKLFAELHPHAKFDTEKFETSRTKKYSPLTLSLEEVIDLLHSTNNLKPLTLLVLIYSSGFRIGELPNLQLKNIGRRQILIRQVKGRKDRNAILAESYLSLLYNYIPHNKPSKLFVEWEDLKPYSSFSIWSSLKHNFNLANTYKPVSPHTSRYSFTTHMLESAIDIWYFQEILGNSRPENTIIYTHLTEKSLKKIKSQLDVS